MQAYDLLYTFKNSNVTRKGVRTVKQFRTAWNNIPYGIDYVFILLHGDKNEKLYSSICKKQF